MPVPVVRAKPDDLADRLLELNEALVARWLVEFLRDEVAQKRGISKAVIGLSGGVDSAVTAYLAAEAFGPENVFTFRMPYKISSRASLEDGAMVVQALGIQDRVVEITDMVDGYLHNSEPEASPTRVGNVCSRSRMVVLFDQAAKLGGLPLGTGNKTERFFGYFTWHGDDAPPVNPLGDLFKTQVWALARHLGVPGSIVDKPPTADLVEGQTDESDFGISYHIADRILALHLFGLNREQVVARGFRPEDVDLVVKKVAGTHWKRHLPTVAILSDSSVNEFYRRPVDYRGRQ